jgi:hypothetical protein
MFPRLFFGVIWVYVFALGCLICCWIWGDLEERTKVIFTFLYLASWGLLFLENFAFLFTVAQCLLVIVIGWATFGVDWLMKNH